MALKPHTTIVPLPLEGGMITSKDAAVIPSGRFSMVQNMRNKHPGFIKRPGMSELNSTAYGSSQQIQTIHQFVKNQIAETKTFAQMSAGDIVQFTNNPPTAGTTLGDEVFDGTASQNPACWSTIADLLIHSNGVDPHKVYAGTDNYVAKCIIYVGTATLDAQSLLDEGLDSTDQATDGDATTTVILGSAGYALGTDADQGLLICTPVPANRLTFTILAANTGNVSSELKYRKSDSSWAATEVTSDAHDGTNTGTATMATTGGAMYWAPPSDEIPHYIAGVCGFWYYLKFDAALDNPTTVTKITYGTDHDSAGDRTAFLDVVNVWDGLDVDAIQVMLHDNSASTYLTFGSGSVDFGGITFDENDSFYVFSYDKLQGIYVDPGASPNTGDAASIDAAYTWDGDSWVAVSSLVDKTSGITKPGWVTWERVATDQPQQFQNAGFYAHVYKFEVDDAVSTDTVAAITCMPYFDITELGNGVANCAWADRIGYSFDRYGQYIHMGKRDCPMVLNGYDYGILEAGDGRSNQTIAMSRFHNEMIAWQEEKGIEGGTTTLFEGYKPGTYGKLLLSSQIGIVNSKAHVFVEGVLTSTATEEKIQNLLFWISRDGIVACNGRVMSMISDDIQNYFDPQEAECIKRGSENQHWIHHDKTFNCLRVGLASGATPTMKYFVFDLVTKTWSEDALGKSLSCAYNIAAASGNVPVVQVGGGYADGKVYKLNTGTNDVSTAISSYIDLELHANGEQIILGDFLLRYKVQAAGDITLTVYANKVSQFTETLSMLAEDTNDVVRRYYEHFDVQNQLITLRLAHATASQSMSLYDLGAELYKWRGW